MSIRGASVDLSAQDTYPEGPQIDLTEPPTASASAFIFQNRHATIDIWISDTGENSKTNNSNGDKILVRAGQSFAYSGSERQLYARAAETGTNVLLWWTAV
jgi:hypothetical protein